MLDDMISLEDYRLTTAEILYHKPDHPERLETYVWRSLDRVPDFPRLNEFLSLWEDSIAGKLHSVKIAYVGTIEPAEWQYAQAVTTLH